MREHALSLEIEEGEGFGPVCDIVGTGGDGHNTFNVSTTAGIVASGAGARVFKVRRSYSYSLHSDLQLKERICIAWKQSGDFIFRFSRYSPFPRMPRNDSTTFLDLFSLPYLFIPIPLRPPLSPSNGPPRTHTETPCIPDSLQCVRTFDQSD